MLSAFSLTLCALALLALPLLIGVGLGLGVLVRVRPKESVVKFVSAFHYIMAILLAVLLFVGMEQRMFAPLQHLSWFSDVLHRYGIDFSLYIDRFSLMYLILSSILTGLIGKFSFFYLHREKGFFRFFILLHFFSLGLNLIIMAGSLNVLLVGWEFMGLTSVLLIAFFQERKGPVQSGLHVFLVYRIGDLALLAMCIWLHHHYGSTLFQKFLDPTKLQELAQGGTFSVAFWLSLLVIVAAVVKASLFPFLNWLPRAMEGPTPSSAIFYGSLSTHMGIFLLIRMYPILEKSSVISVLLIVVGTISAFLSSLIGRIQSDAKNSLAYATTVQLGIMLIEIGMGWIWVAQIHLFGHAMLRAFQFLKTPSLLHLHHEMVSLYGQNFAPTGIHLESLFPKPLQIWLYHVAMEGGFLETIAQRFVIQPVVRFSSLMNRIEEHFLQKGVLGSSKVTDRSQSAEAPTEAQSGIPNTQEQRTLEVKELSPKEISQ